MGYKQLLPAGAFSEDEGGTYLINDPAFREANNLKKGKNIMQIQEYLDYELCYIGGCFMYFTNDFENQWGDDWDDVPYEYNAGLPYGYRDEDGPDIFVIAYRDHRFACLQTPKSHKSNSSYSVDAINHHSIPWLKDYYDEESIKIWGGDTLEKVLEKIKGIEEFEIFYPESLWRD